MSKFSRGDVVVVGEHVVDFSHDDVTPGAYFVALAEDEEGDVGISRRSGGYIDHYVQASKLHIESEDDAAAKTIADTVSSALGVSSSFVRNGGFVTILGGVAYVVSVEKVGDTK